MAVGRDSAVVTMAVLCLLVVALQCEATTYVVGDKSGWAGNIGGWAKGKDFKADDVLGILSTSYHYFTYANVAIYLVQHFLLAIYI